MGFRMKNFNVMGVSLKNPIFRGGGGSRKTNIKEELPKKEGGGLGESPDERKKAWQKKGGWCF